MANLKKLDKISKKILRKLPENSNVEKRIKETIKRIASEYKNCIAWKDGLEYYPVQQFRPLMEKIINTINLLHYGEEYYDYLDYVSEHQSITNQRDFILGDINHRLLQNREAVFSTNPLIRDIGIENINSYKFYKFTHDFRPLYKDSSFIIHDDNSTYKIKISENVVNDLGNIVLFFYSNILITVSPLKKKKHKEFLKLIDRESSKVIIKSKLIREKGLRQVQRTVRGIEVTTGFVAG